METKYSKEERDETLRRAIANIYYYLEMDEEKDKDLRLVYKLMWTKRKFDDLYYANEDNKEEFEKVLKREIELKLRLTHINKILDYRYESDIFNPNLLFLSVVVSITKSDYLDSIYLSVGDLIPFVDIYNHRLPIDLRGIELVYKLGPRLTGPLKDLFDEEKTY